MVKINKKMEYSLMVLKYMSEKKAGELTSVKEVSEKSSIPFDATARVMQQMASHGILRSEQGPRGGYQIVQSLDNITFKDLGSAVIGSLNVVRCLGEEKHCELSNHCNIKKSLNILNTKLLKFYSDLKLTEILSTGL